VQERAAFRQQRLNQSRQAYILLGLGISLYRDQRRLESPGDLADILSLGSIGL